MAFLNGKYYPSKIFTFTEYNERDESRVWYICAKDKQHAYQLLTEAGLKVGKIHSISAQVNFGIIKAENWKSEGF